MKKILTILLILFAFNAKTQTPQLKIINNYDSTVMFSACSPALGFVISFTAHATGINTTLDTLKSIVYWGDGTNSTNSQVFLSTGTPNNYYFGIGHTYYTSGIFDVKIKIWSKLTGASDSIILSSLIIIGTHCDTICGDFYWDYNHDCQLNINETLLNHPFTNLKLYSGNYFIRLDSNYNIFWQNAYYKIIVPDGIPNQPAYKLKLKNPGLFGGLCPINGEYIIPSLPSIHKDFGFQCDTNIDNAIYISNAKVAFSNLQGVVNFKVINLHCDSVQATIKIVIDPKTTAGLNSNPLPSSVISSITGDTMVYSNVWIHSLETKAFQLNLAAMPTIIVGDTLYFKAIVIPANTEVKLANNYDTVMIRVVASFDPNEIQVSPFGIIHNQTILYYNIDFQNTGNAPAAKVVIIDSLSNKLDMSTFTFKGSSHAVEIQKLQNNIVKFIFNPIYLPDSGQNREGSKGYVSFSIKTSGILPLGTQIPNKAWIYFDDNPPVETNTVVNYIDSLINLPETINERNSKDIAVIYPNPAYDFINVKFNENLKDASITIYDLRGRMVYYQLCNEKNFQIPVHSIENGLYLIQLRNKTITKLKKMLICR